MSDVLRPSWFATYAKFLLHNCATENEIMKTLNDVAKVFYALPSTLRAKVNVELLGWGRDDFINLDGYFEALETVKEWLEA